VAALSDCASVRCETGAGGDRAAKMLAERRGRKRHEFDGEQQNELSQSKRRSTVLVK
jgi:hypothetical protein